jgi:hypothetical protein
VCATATYAFGLSWRSNGNLKQLRKCNRLPCMSTLPRSQLCVCTFKCLGLAPQLSLIFASRPSWALQTARHRDRRHPVLFCVGPVVLPRARDISKLSLSGVVSRTHFKQSEALQLPPQLMNTFAVALTRRLPSHPSCAFFFSMRRSASHPIVLPLSHDRPCSNDDRGSCLLPEWAWRTTTCAGIRDVLLV